MQKRTQLAIVILVGILLLGLGVYLLVSPYLADQTASQQPPALPDQVTPVVVRPPPTNTTITTPTGTAPAPTPVGAVQRELENRSRAVVERVGSGTSVDGFLGYQDALLDMTASGRTQLLSQQQAMQTAHPTTATSYSLSTRAVSTALTEGVVGDAKIIMTVEAIQRVDIGSSTNPTSQAKRVAVTFVKQADGAYLIDSLEWSDIAL
jgi:hypothetical protein